MYCSSSPIECNHILSGRSYEGVALLWHKRDNHLIASVKTACDCMVTVRLHCYAGILFQFTCLQSIVTLKL